MSTESSLLSSFMSSLADFLPTAHAEEKAVEAEEDSPDPVEDEEEEPEDTAPGIREAIGNSKACSSFKHHFEECAERVSAGNVQLHGETCVEELFHFMHCVDSAAADKVFATLK